MLASGNLVSSLLDIPGPTVPCHTAVLITPAETTLSAGAGDNDLPDRERSDPSPRCRYLEDCEGHVPNSDPGVAHPLPGSLLLKMVYCGKPSKGCSNCRERKIRVSGPSISVVVPRLYPVQLGSMCQVMAAAAPHHRTASPVQNAASGILRGIGTMILARSLTYISLSRVSVHEARR